MKSLLSQNGRMLQSKIRRPSVNPTQFRNSKKIIKKYGNRKLYDTEQSSYVVLRDIEKMVRNREDIQVIDNETQNDITISTLTQIIFSSEKRSKFSPPISVLKSIIREGDGSLSSFFAKIGLVPGSKLETTSHRQKRLRGRRSASKLSSSPTALGQKIAKLMKNNEEEDRSIPKLPSGGGRYLSP